MSFGSPATESWVLRTVGASTVAVVIIFAVGVTNESVIRAQPRQVKVKPAAVPKVRLSDESAGIDEIARTLISAFDECDIVALGEAHGRFRQESDLRIALVRNPDFAKKVRFIVVEFASVTEQPTLDRYIRGENVSPAELAQVWKTTTQAANGNDIWDSPIYPEFFAAVRDVNAKLPADMQIRVLGGDPGLGDNRSRESLAVSVIEEQVLQKHGKALVIYGAAHFYRTLDKDYVASTGDNNDIVKTLDIDYPGRIFVAIPIGWLDRPRPVAVDSQPDYQKFDRALKTQVRPVLVPLQRLPFRDFNVEEFLGRTVITCRGSNGCVSAFKGSTLTLGQMGDACIYFGGTVDAKGR
jgi:hypothetical protein